MKVVTMRLLTKLGACSEGKDYAQTYCVNLSYVDAIRRCVKDDKLQWAYWGIVHVLTHVQQVKYAIYAAKQAVAIYEANYPGDTRPRDAIKAAERWIKNPTKENAAANAANAAAYAANAAAYAAYAANAAQKEMQLKILRYGLRILAKQEAPDGR